MKPKPVCELVGPLAVAGDRWHPQPAARYGDAAVEVWDVGWTLPLCSQVCVSSQRLETTGPLRMAGNVYDGSVYARNPRGDYTLCGMLRRVRSVTGLLCIPTSLVWRRPSEAKCTVRVGYLNATGIVGEATAMGVFGPELGRV